MSYQRWTQKPSMVEELLSKCYVAGGWQVILSVTALATRSVWKSCLLKISITAGNMELGYAIRVCWSCEFDTAICMAVFICFRSLSYQERVRSESGWKPHSFEIVFGDVFSAVLPLLQGTATGSVPWIWTVVLQLTAGQDAKCQTEVCFPLGGHLCLQAIPNVSLYLLYWP